MEIIIYVLIVIVIAFLRSPRIKGNIGESHVNLALYLGLDKKIYHYIHNVILPTDTGTTQIDHVIVSPFGVFVVETKNMKGWIFGSANNRKWTQTIYGSKHSFQNPLRQNYKHVRVLQDLLQLSSHQIFSVVVFVGNCKFKTDMPDNVTKLAWFTRYIKSYTEQVLDAETLRDIVDKIENSRFENTRKANREHVRHVRNIASGNVPPHTQSDIPCPRCGSPMVLKTAKQGANAGNQFWGCSQFPRCRATKSA